MNFEIGEIITVPDSVNPDVEVPAIVTGVSADGESANVQVFGGSDVIEKRVITAADFEDESPEAETETPPATATGSRRAPATTDKEGE